MSSKFLASYWQERRNKNLDVMFDSSLLTGESKYLTGIKR